MPGASAWRQVGRLLEASMATLLGFTILQLGPMPGPGQHFLVYFSLGDVINRLMYQSTLQVAKRLTYRCKVFAMDVQHARP